MSRLLRFRPLAALVPALLLLAGALGRDGGGLLRVELALRDGFAGRLLERCTGAALGRLAGARKAPPPLELLRGAALGRLMECV